MRWAGHDGTIEDEFVRNVTGRAFCACRSRTRKEWGELGMTFMSLLDM